MGEIQRARRTRNAVSVALLLLLACSAARASDVEATGTWRWRTDVLGATSFMQPATGFGWLINEQERALRPPELRDPPAFHASLLLHPVIIETTGKQRPSGWATWLSGGLYLYTDGVYELGLAYAAGDGAAAGERYAMMTFTAEF